MLKQGYNKSQIAQTIGKDKSVVHREINRNSDGRNGEYRGDLAHRKYHLRQKEKKKHKKFTFQMQGEVEELLREDFSPEQVVGTLKNEKNNRSFFLFCCKSLETLIKKRKEDLTSDYESFIIKVDAQRKTDFK